MLSWKMERDVLSVTTMLMVEVGRGGGAEWPQVTDIRRLEYLVSCAIIICVPNNGARLNRVGI